MANSMLVKNKLLKYEIVHFTISERCRPFTTFEFGVESVGFVEAKGKVMVRRGKNQIKSSLIGRTFFAGTRHQSKCPVREALQVFQGLQDHLRRC